MKRRPILAVAAAALLAGASAAAAQQPGHETRSAERVRPPDRAVELAQATPPPAARRPDARRNQLYGDELFTPAERQAFFDRMKAAQTPEERARLVAERRATAEARAQEKGVPLPEARLPAPGAPAPRAQ